MNSFKALIKSVFHPKTCAGCGAIIDEGEALCDYCHEMLVRCDPLKRCIKCGLSEANCCCNRKIFHFDGCVAPFINTAVAQNAVYSFKFARKMIIGEFLAEQMALSVKNEYRDIKFDGVCFVPMLKRKRLRRGFNQSRVLAEKIADLLGLPLYNLLICRKNAPSQHGLKAKERFLNVKGMYQASVQAKGKTLLLVDDIKTTGATLDECAKQLLLSGAAGVYCVTALITESRKNNAGK